MPLTHKADKILPNLFPHPISFPITSLYLRHQQSGIVLAAGTTDSLSCTYSPPPSPHRTTSDYHPPQLLQGELLAFKSLYM